MAITLAAEHDKDEALYQRARANNLDLEKENLRIQRFNEDLVIAIAIDRPLNGKVATTYRAYPVDSTGKIHKDIPLIAKIIHFTETEKENVAQQRIKLNHIEAEAKNGNVLFSSKIGKIKNGRIILMSAVPGAPLLTLIETNALNKLTAIQRIRLCINILEVYAILHKQGIFHRDVTAGNMLIYLATLRGMPVDIDPSHQTQLTQAPEQEASAQSDLFSITLDIFMSILSGIRPSRDTEGNTLNEEEIETGIRANFGELADEIIALVGIDRLTSNDPAKRGTLAEAQQALQALFDSEAFLYCIAPDILIPLLSDVDPQIDEDGYTINIEEITEGISTNFGEQTNEIIALLTTLASDLPEDRKTLEHGQKAFKELECLIEGRQQDEIQQKNTQYDKQLRVLDTVLKDPQFKNRISTEECLIEEQQQDETQQENTQGESSYNTYRYFPRAGHGHRPPPIAIPSPIPIPVP